MKNLSESQTGPAIPEANFAPKGCFHGGAFFESIGEEFDHIERRSEVINADVLDAWFPPAPSVLQVLADHLSWTCRTSPPTNCSGLVRAIARARGIDPGCVLPAAGSSSLMFLALRHWLTPSSRVLLLDPTYNEYAHICEHVIGCSVDYFSLVRESHYRIDLSRWAQEAESGYDLAVLVNPNNPTGQHLSREELEPVLERVARRCRVWVDEAYIDYAGAGESLEGFAASRENLVVCKSLSKVNALSGLRVAYLCASRSVVGDLWRLTPPWAVSLPAQIGAVQALQESDYYLERWQETHILRSEFISRLRTICPRAEITDGCINSILWHLPVDGINGEELVRRCRVRNLFIRGVSGLAPALDSHTVRISVKDHATQERMMEVLSWALSQNGRHLEHASLDH